MRETLTIKLVRHGSKNNDPSAHGTGIEALLNPLKIKDIVAFAARELQQLPQCGAVEVKSTPVPRALETARLVSQIFALDPEVRVRLGVLGRRRTNRFDGSKCRRQAKEPFSPAHERDLG